MKDPIQFNSDQLEAAANMVKAQHIDTVMSRVASDLMGQAAPSVKPTNPKDAIGSSKLPLHLVPDIISVAAATAFAEGASKYGAYNWRAAGVRTSIYVSALRRHLDKFWNGQDTDPKTLVHHLASVIACAGILLDAKACGMLNDDRPPEMDLDEEIACAELVVAHVVALNAHHKPHHWTIKDELP